MKGMQKMPTRDDSFKVEYFTVIDLEITGIRESSIWVRLPHNARKVSLARSLLKYSSDQRVKAVAANADLVGEKVTSIDPIFMTLEIVDWWVKRNNLDK